MRLYAECIPCQVRTRLRDIERLVEDEDKRIEITKELIKILDTILSKCRPGYYDPCIPTIIATNLFRYMKRVTGMRDPYKMVKEEINRESLELYQKLRKVVEDAPSLRDRIIAALKISLLGNLLDTGVADHVMPKTQQILTLINSLSIYGDVEQCINILLSSNNVVIVLDNAGEAVLDRVLADVLRGYGKKVIAIVKGGAFQNDITIDDIDSAKLNESFDTVLDTGTDASSVFIDEVKKEVLDMLRKTDVIVSKGMANYEYLTSVENSLGKTIIYMLIAKCTPIAKDLGVPLGGAVIKVSNCIKN